MDIDPRKLFRSWKCQYHGPLTLVPPPSEDGITYVVTENFNQPAPLPYRRPVPADFDWMK